MSLEQPPGSWTKVEQNDLFDNRSIKAAVEPPKKTTAVNMLIMYIFKDCGLEAGLESTGPRFPSAIEAAFSFGLSQVLNITCPGTPTAGVA